MPPALAVQSIDQLLSDVRVGDRYEIRSGSRVGKLRVRGSVTVDERTADRATIAVTCRVFGVPSHGRIEVALEADGAVSIAVLGLPFLAIGVVGTPVELEDARFILDIDPGELLEVAHGADELEITASGLKVGAIRVALGRLDD